MSEIAVCPVCHSLTKRLSAKTADVGKFFGAKGTGLGAKEIPLGAINRPSALPSHSFFSFLSLLLPCCQCHVSSVKQLWEEAQAGHVPQL